VWSTTAMCFLTKSYRCFYTTASNRTKNFTEIGRMFKFFHPLFWCFPYKRPNLSAVYRVVFRQFSLMIWRISSAFSSVRSVQQSCTLAICSQNFRKFQCTKPVRNSVFCHGIVTKYIFSVLVIRDVFFLNLKQTKRIVLYKITYGISHARTYTIIWEAGRPL
jgi:hypothetical protein